MSTCLKAATSKSLFAVSQIIGFKKHTPARKQCLQLEDLNLLGLETRAKAAVLLQLQDGD